MNDHPFQIVLMVVVLATVTLIMLAMAVFFFSLFRPWLRAFLSGASISVVQLLGMRLRGVPPGLVVDALVTLVHRGHGHDPRRSAVAESIYLSQRGLIHSSQQLADLVEKRLAKNEPVEAIGP